MLTVVNQFKELNHEGHVYNSGDTYPAEGFEVDAERVAFLSQTHPKYKKVYLKEEVKEQEELTLPPEKPADDTDQTEAVVDVKKAPKKTTSKEKIIKDGE